MKKIRKPILVLFTIIFLLTSCNNKVQIPSNEDISDGYVSVIFTNKIHVKSGEIVTLEGDYSLGDKIVLKTSDDSSSRAITKSNMYKTNDGKIIPIPSKDNKISFDPADLGIGEEGDILVGKFVNKDDLTITAKERLTKNLNNFYDEYYYVNLSSPDYNDLDKSNIYIRQSQLSGNKLFSIVLEEQNLISQEQPINMSSKEGFGLYQFYSGQTKNETEPNCTLYIKNPIELNNIGEKKTLTDSFSIIKVAKNQENELCVVFSNIDDELMDMIIKSRLALKTNPLKLGEERSKHAMAIPYFLSDRHEIVYYLGKVKQDMCFDIDFTEFTEKIQKSNISIELVSNDYYKDIASTDYFFDISNIPEGKVSVYAPKSNSKYITLVFKTDKTILANIETQLRNTTLYLYELDNGSKGTQSFRTGKIEINSSGITIGYMILENSNIPESREICTISLADKVKAEIGHNYVFNSDNKTYSCTKHKDCYSFSGGTDWKNLFDSILKISNGKYVTETSHEEYPQIWITNNKILFSNTDNPINNSVGNNSSDKRYVLKSIYNDVIFMYEIASFDNVSETEKYLNGELIIQKNGEEILRQKDVMFAYSK